MIIPARSHRFLGVLVDDALRWDAHAKYALGKGTAYVLQLRRLSLASKGIPLPLMKQLYTSVAVPKMLYAVDIWLKPLYSGTSTTPQRGSIGVVKKMNRVQRLALFSITGAMRSTATDAMEAHAKLTPLAHRIQNLCHQAALRIAAHPETHPLHLSIRKAAKRYVKKHRSSLHNLTHAFSLDPSLTEMINHSRRPPSEKLQYVTNIASSREEAIQQHDESVANTRVYCDGSGIDRNIGAAAVLYVKGKRPRSLKYHLGTVKEHTVYEAEAVGLTLAAHLLNTERDLDLPIAIFVDNQAVIKSGDVFETKPGHYLTDHFRRSIRTLKRKLKCKTLDLSLDWISGHDGVDGNEKADEEAKEAAKGPDHSSPRRHLPAFLRKGPLPLSISAVKQSQREVTKKRWAQEWAASPRYSHLSKIDPKLLSGSFIKLVSPLPRRQSSLLIWLRTNHAALNAELHRMKKSDTPHCPHCPGITEDVKHLILSCPQYARERSILTQHLRRKASDIPHLLSHSKAIPFLLNYVNSTGRFKATFGDVSTTSK